MTEGQVREFVTKEAFQGEQLAQNMWMRTLTTAPQITSYFLGYDQVKTLYEEARQARGSAFVLRRFMDGMMEMGPVPVSEYRSDCCRRGSKRALAAAPLFRREHLLDALQARHGFGMQVIELLVELGDLEFGLQIDVVLDVAPDLVLGRLRL